MADLNHYTCIQIRPPAELFAKANMLAIQENPANGHHITAAGGTTQGPEGSLALALPVGLKWRNGRTLRVRILNGTPRIKTKVRQYAAAWSTYANITFDFVDSGDAEIRVNIDSSGNSWSYVGTWNLSVPPTDPTMNLGWLTDSSPETEFSSTILHEFGHALGCVHEHSPPVAGIPWDVPAAYAHYDAAGWSRKWVDQNIFQAYNSMSTQYPEFDPTSIMVYPIAASLTTNGFSVGMNSQLSEMDRSFITDAYPNDGDSSIASFNTMQVRPWDQPAQDAVMQEHFPITFYCPPKLAVGLNWLDVSSSANIRVNAFADNTTTSTADIHINTWSDTTLYSAGCTWFPTGAAANDPDFQVGHFDTTEDHPWQNPQQKTSRQIAFERAYLSPPKVIVWLNKLSLASGKGWRISATAMDVTTTGFTLHIDSWADTVIYSAAAAWIAHPSDKAGVISGSYSTLDVRPRGQPQLDNSGEVTFPHGTFQRVPAVLFALNELSVDPGRNLRLRLAVSSMSKEGLNWHIDSWGDTILYSASASFIAFA